MPFLKRFNYFSPYLTGNPVLPQLKLLTPSSEDVSKLKGSPQFCSVAGSSTEAARADTKVPNDMQREAQLSQDKLVMISDIPYSIKLDGNPAAGKTSMTTTLSS